MYPNPNTIDKIMAALDRSSTGIETETSIIFTLFFSQYNLQNNVFGNDYTF
jgi:hypothetical protein